MLLITIALLLPQWALSGIIEVPGQYSTIQEAIDVAVNGDTILGSPGTYSEHINFKGKEIVLKSHAGPRVTNSIIRNNTFWNGNPTVQICETPSVTYSNIEGGWPGTGNIDKDPLFVDASYALFDFHLTYQSPCRDCGDNAAVVNRIDFEGDPRIAHGKVDMGCDEFHSHLYCTGEFEPSGHVKAKLVGLPRTTPVWLFISDKLIDPPLHTPWGHFYLASPWLLVPLQAIPENGILIIEGGLPALPVTPYKIFLQALIRDLLSNMFILDVNQS